jgi:hypothetical protein
MIILKSFHFVNSNILTIELHKSSSTSLISCTVISAIIYLGSTTLIATDYIFYTSPFSYLPYIIILPS